MLTVVPDELGDEYPVIVEATLKDAEVTTNGHIPLPPANRSSSHRPTRRDSDAGHERDLVPREKRKIDDTDSASNKRRRTASDDGDTIPLITKEDLDDLLVKLRNNIQYSSSDCIGHVQHLLRRFKGPQHDQTPLDHEHSQQPHLRRHKSIPQHIATLPSPTLDHKDRDNDKPTPSVTATICHESALLSRQIKWVEDCRRVASDLHTKREDTWRTSCAGFHDRQRVSREQFQNRMLNKAAKQARMLRMCCMKSRQLDCLHRV